MKLTGPQRAAVIVAQLDDARASRLLRLLSENEVIRLMAEVARLPALTPDDVKSVIDDFAQEAGGFLQVRQGGVMVAERWLQDRLGPARAAEVMAELRMMSTEEPLSFLHTIGPAEIAAFLADEHPQTIAVIMSSIPSEHAAKVIDCFSDDKAAKIVRRMATLGPIPSSVLTKVAEGLENRLADLSRGASHSSSGGVPVAAAVLNNVDRTTEREILLRIEAENPELAEVIRNEMFVFDDISHLDDVALQMVLREVTPKDIALALKTASPDLQERFLSNVSERTRADLEEELVSLGPQRLSVIEAAQSEIVRVVREMIDNGAIAIGRGSDELIA